MDKSLLFNKDSVIRVPFLVKGKLIAPPEISRGEIEEAFRITDSNTVYLKLPHAQISREPVVDRQTTKYTGEYIYQVMHFISGSELIENDIDKLASTLYSLS
ncbi:MAG: hypothetical protein PHE15_06960, partial [Dehalococcoidales bacterium]|nr:hypothetical protein [Dehalococcoidales bacterium]